MPLLLLVSLLVAGLLALLPVWRLRVAGWPPRWLLAAGSCTRVGIFVVRAAAGRCRFVLPIVVLAFVAPFVAGPERLTRVLVGRRRRPAVVIDVTPRAAPGIDEPPRHVEGEVIDDDPEGPA